MKPATAASFSRWGPPARSASSIAASSSDQRSRKSSVEDLVLGAEVVVEEPVGDPRLVGDVRDTDSVEALAGEDPDRGVEDLPAPVDRRRFPIRPPSGVDGGGGGWPARAARPGSGLPARSRSAAMNHSASGAAASTHAPGVDDRRASAGLGCGAASPTWFGGEHEALVLDRPGPQQHVPVVAAGGRREGGRDGDSRAPRRARIRNSSGKRRS